MSASPARRLAGVVVTAIVLVAGACSVPDQSTASGGTAGDVATPTTEGVIDSGGDPTTTAPTTTQPTTTAPPATTAPPTTAPPTTETPPTTPAPPVEPEPAPEPDRWQQGSEGAEVTAIQTRLVELGFHVPAVDGKFGSITQQAVLAFQKGAGLSRDGVVGPQTLEALETAEQIGPLEGGDHIEIDLARQLMFVVRGEATFIFNTSTGASGWETPPGRFTITREIDGMRHAELGDLWRPKYFNDGIALHGSNSIPGYPASHGCARLHNDIINMIWDQDLAPVGTPVWVY